MTMGTFSFPVRYADDMKRKERPPKDKRPKEKRFRHGGRKGRRSRA